MKRIFKYVLVIDDEFIVEMPRNAKILHVGLQPDVSPLGEQICLWVLVEEGNPLEKKTIKIRGTGHNADGCLVERFIGTVIMAQGKLVFHIFEG